MARGSALASLLGLVLLAGVVVGSMGQEKMGSTLPELEETSQMARKMLEGNETETEETPSIEPCSPAYKGRHPRGYLIKSPGKTCSSNATVCTKFDELQCGMIEECKNVTKVNCTETTTVKTFFGALVEKCTNSTTTVEKKCEDFKVCTYFACVPGTPGDAKPAPGPTGAPKAPAPASG